MEFILNAVGVSAFLSAICFIGVIGHLVITDFGLIRHDRNYMSFVFSSRKRHLAAAIAFGALTFTLLALVFALVGFRDAT